MAFSWKTEAEPLDKLPNTVFDGRSALDVTLYGDLSDIVKVGRCLNDSNP